jgi:hypothetical protein
MVGNVSAAFANVLLALRVICARRNLALLVAGKEASVLMPAFVNATSTGRPVAPGCIKNATQRTIMLLVHAEIALRNLTLRLPVI